MGQGVGQRGQGTGGQSDGQQSPMVILIQSQPVTSAHGARL